MEKEQLSTSTKEEPKVKLALQEKYKYMLGQAHAYQFISGEISNLLNKGAKDGNGKVVDIRDERSPKA